MLKVNICQIVYQSQALVRVSTNEVNSVVLKDIINYICELYQLYQSVDYINDTLYYISML